MTICSYNKSSGGVLITRVVVGEGGNGAKLVLNAKD